MKITASLLILLSVLHVKAYGGVLHEDIGVTGCSDTEGVDMYGLDGEVKWYADFIKQKGVNPVPDYIDPITFPYPAAVGNLHNCRANLAVIRKNFNIPPVEEKPDTRLYPRDPVEVGVANTLICHVTGFYPAPVSISWTRNTLNLTDDITDDITTSVPIFNRRDVTFYQFSRLKFTPEQGDIYSCTVNHQSLPGPETSMWDVDIQHQSSVGPDVYCAVGLTIAVLGVAMGTFFLIKGNQCNY